MIFHRSSGCTRQIACASGRAVFRRIQPVDPENSMRCHLLPLGLAVAFFSPYSALPLHAAPVDLDVGAAAARDSVTHTGVAEPQGELTLASARALALAANPTLSASMREVEAREAAIRQAGVWRNPELSVLMEDTRNATRQTTLQIDQPLELGGKRAARIGAAEQGRDAAEAELAAQRLDLRATVKAAFYDVLVAQEKQRLAQASVELAQRATHAASRRVTAGKVSPVEETRARIAEAGVRIDLAQADSELARARQALAATWGGHAPRFERVEGDLQTLPPLTEMSELQSRLLDSPALRRARIEVERRLALTRIETSRRVPDVTLSFGARRNEELGLNQAILGVSVPLPVFDRNQGNVLEAERRSDQARDELRATEVRLAGALTFAHEQMNAARATLGALQRDILPGATRAYDAASQGFEAGKFSFLDVLDAQRTLFAARAQHLRALADVHRAATDIEGLIGDFGPEPASADATLNPAATPAAQP
jgi:cobalt-zinc-cadmium efflux system outer membrane protein